jgi:tRNA threonylcarbamoyl adenosine modification protein (Sua5/YciO/YrdC/YwlC family)
MAQIISIHPDNPQARLIGQAVAILRHGGVVAYPTDSCYALGCLPGEKTAVDKILRVRRLDPGHYMTLLCRDLSDTGSLARVDNKAFRLLKKLTPGPYTFVLKAGREVPRRLQDSKAKTIGIRVPDNTIVLALLQALGEPLLSTSLILPGEDMPETEAREIDRKIGSALDLIIEGGSAGREQTTIIDLTGDEPVVVREGKGDIAAVTG